MDIENNDKKLMEYFKLIYEKQNKRNFDKIPIEVRNRRYKKLKEVLSFIFSFFHIEKNS